MEFPGKLSLHLQQQSLCGGEWGSLPWTARNGISQEWSQPELVAWMFLWSSFIPLSLMIYFVPVPCTPCCLTQPARGTKRNVKLLFCMELLLPSGKALWASVLLRKGHPEGCFPQPSSPKPSLQLEESQPSSLLQGMARAQKSSSTGTNAPTPGSCQHPPRSWGCQDKCQNQPRLRVEIKYFNCTFFPPKISSACCSTQTELAIFRCYISKTSLWPFFFLPHCQVLRRRELPSDLQLCANLPPLKRKSNGHRLTRCFMLENWNFVFPVLFQGWFLYTQCTYPAKPELCLSGAELKGRQALVFASRFWTFATQRLCVKCNIKPLTIFIPASDMSYTLGIFSHWMQDDSFSS